MKNKKYLIIGCIFALIIFIICFWYWVFINLNGNLTLEQKKLEGVLFPVSTTDLQSAEYAKAKTYCYAEAGCRTFATNYIPKNSIDHTVKGTYIYPDTLWQVGNSGDYYGVIYEIRDYNPDDESGNYPKHKPNSDAHVYLGLLTIQDKKYRLISNLLLSGIENSDLSKIKLENRNDGVLELNYSVDWAKPLNFSPILFKIVSGNLIPIVENR